MLFVCVCVRVLALGTSSCLESYVCCLGVGGTWDPSAAPYHPATNMSLCFLNGSDVE